MTLRSFNQPIDPRQVLIDLPLFEQFYERIVAIAQQYSSLGDRDPHGIEILDGFILRSSHQFKNGGYWCTPLNTLEFANTGMDGEHFSFVIQGDRIDAQSPIVFTAPMNYGGNYNVTLAPSFAIFLGLAIRYGFFALGELAYHPAEAIPRFETLSWTAKGDDGVNNETQLQILNDLTQQLLVKPYVYRPQEFETLQQCCLIMSQDYTNQLKD